MKAEMNLIHDSHYFNPPVKYFVVRNIYNKVRKQEMILKNHPNKITVKQQIEKVVCKEIVTVVKIKGKCVFLTVCKINFLLHVKCPCTK